MYTLIEKDSHLVDLLLSPLKRVHNMTSELFQSGGGVEHLKNLKVKEYKMFDNTKFQNNHLGSKYI